MNATTFDALAAARDLEAAGFERRQAEALAESLRSAAGARHDALATKTDVDALRTAAKADVDALRTAATSDLTGLETRIDAKLAGLEARMYRALWIQGGAIVAILTALRFLPA